MMGSRARRDAVMNGADAVEVADAGKADAYRTTRAGDGRGHALVENAGVKDPYDIAKQPGGRHHGMLVNIRETLGVNQLASGIDKMTRQIADHQRWIQDPSLKPGVELHPPESVNRWRQVKWPSDILRLKEQRAIYEAVLKEKKDGTLTSGA